MQKRIVFIILFIVLKAILELVYCSFIAPLYSYSGLVWEPNFTKFFHSYFIFIVMLILIPIKQDTPSNQLVALLFLVTYTPISSFYWMSDSSIRYFTYVSISILLIIVIVKYLKMIKIKYISIPKINYLDIANLLLILTLFLLIIFTVISGGIDVRALNFNSIYELRSEDNYSGILGYLFNWIPKVFIPLLIIIYYFEDKKIRLLLSISLQVYYYLMTGHKSFLFSIILLIAISYLLKSKKYLFGLPIFFSLLVSISIFMYKITDNLFFIALMPTRQLMIPAHLSFKHYEFFLNNEKLFFSESAVGRIFNIDSPYNQAASYIIGGTFGNANTGFLGDAFGNAGFPLMLVYSTIIALIFKIIDSMSQISQESYKYTAFLVYSVIILNDTGLLIGLLTSGISILLIFMYIYSSSENKLNTRKKE